jgi:hypothetical protein
MARTSENWRNGGGEDWPTLWDHAVADKWPKLSNDRWTPDHAGPALIVCERGDSQSMVVVMFENATAAEQADRALYDRRCGPGCLREHYRVWAEPGKLHVERGIHDPDPLPHDLASALWALGYRRANGIGKTRPPQMWPAPREFNEPLRP